MGSPVFGAHKEDGRRRALELIFECAADPDMQRDFSPLGYGF